MAARCDRIEAEILVQEHNQNQQSSQPSTRNTSRDLGAGAGALTLRDSDS